ncbi:MAG TPA: P-loop NTPase [Anaerolineae bacterium]|nr:P-loop NTPase [Anaerolineae bacterium]
MKKIVILSGKGGTGKTTVAAALAHLASERTSLVLVDADVDAANLELLLSPLKQEKHDFWGSKVAEIDSEVCNSCAKCFEVCRFDAVMKLDSKKARTNPQGDHSRFIFRIDPTACDGCAACFYQCPVDAIRLLDRKDGEWFRSKTRYGALFHAHLFAGHENSGKLVNILKQRANNFISQSNAELLLIDGPPGIGCPVIAASSDVDLALLIVEPTVSGIHDLKRILDTTHHFKIPAFVVINKADLNRNLSMRIIRYLDDNGLMMIGEIPFDTIVIEAVTQGKPVTEYSNGQVSLAIKNIWNTLEKEL